MKFYFSTVIFFACFIFIASCDQKDPKSNSENNSNEDLELKEKGVFISPLGKELMPLDPPEVYVENYKQAKSEYDKDSSDLDNIIWYGRRTAYLGNYQDAINIYTRGIFLFPDEPRLYRHRGHRYISVRKFDKAIADLEKAAELVEGKENQVEPDGIPNAMNTPISTLQGNIWYHLGLAYYLENDLEEAFSAYLKGRDIGENDDNLVSTTHWLYMIKRRQDQEESATELLNVIHDEMDIIENQAYYDLCRFYKGLIPLDSLLGPAGSPSGDAVKYGVANWNLYNGNWDQAKKEMEDILDGPSWSSFGYIAAEQDYLRFFARESNKN